MSGVGGIIAFFVPSHLIVTKIVPEPWLDRSKFAAEPGEMAMFEGQEIVRGWLTGLLSDGAGEACATTGSVKKNIRLLRVRR
jgi:hypothetical protein